MKVKEKKDYPLVLTAKEVQEILNVGRRVAYELMDEEDFPCVRLGNKLKRVGRDDFFDWLQRKGQPRKKT